ncbi:hypothetical protein RhiirA5_444043 [Rhizophagus irregularis]|uniref:Uncharacterized protein n=1 Tax=Rhizophagus irregularis TaxID=588596 RepID=A0A2N0NDG8_9GLOM|nr:hypothetical protein RhiirA5_444043 [Rhizophagus irregularis]
MDMTTEINDKEVTKGRYEVQENRRIYRVRRKANRANTVSKPGKIPVCFNKPETKVPVVYYFVSLFLIKWVGKAIKNIIEAILYVERVVALKYEQIKMQNAEILKKMKNWKKNWRKVI